MRLGTPKNNGELFDPSAFRRLSRREETFAWLVATRGNQSRARLEAGYRDYGNAARNAQEAYRLAQKPHIQSAVAKYSRQHLEQLGVTVERLLAEATALATSELRDGFRDGQLLPMDQWPAEFSRAVQSYEERELQRTTKKGRDGTTVETVIVGRKIRLHPKSPSLEKMLEAALIAMRRGQDGEPEPEDLDAQALLEIERGGSEPS